MRDMIILACILCFWIVLGFTLTSVYSDTLITAALLEGNSTYIIDTPTISSLTDNNSQYDVPLFQPVVVTKTKGFIDMIIRMFTFRVPIVSEIPAGVIYFLEAVNFGLLLFVGLIVYRLIRHGGG